MIINNGEDDDDNDDGSLKASLIWHLFRSDAAHDNNDVYDYEDDNCNGNE